MAHTDVTITNDSGKLVPSRSSVPVVDGDSVTFSTAGGEKAGLFFSPDAVSVLSPQPTNPVSVSGNEGQTFTFTSSDEGAYSVFFEREGGWGPNHFPDRSSNQLVMEIEGWGHFGGPIIGINTSGRTSND